MVKINVVFGGPPIMLFHLRYLRLNIEKERDLTRVTTIFKRIGHNENYLKDQSKTK